MTDYPWPDSCAGPDIPRELCHALGVLVVNWNWCESAQGLLLQWYLNSRHHALVINPMPSNTRANLLADLTEESEKRPEVKEAVDHFRLCYSICLENRNLLIHSLGTPFEFLAGNEMTFVRQAKRLGQNNLFIPADPNLVINVAYEVMAAFTHGMQIFSYLLGKRPTLPQKPPKPGRLMDLPPMKSGEPPQPESSHG